MDKAEAHLRALRYVHQHLLYLSQDMELQTRRGQRGLESTWERVHDLCTKIQKHAKLVNLDISRDRNYEKSSDWQELMHADTREWC
jgi:hypothetical protein